MKLLARWLDSDVGHSFRSSPMAMAAAAVAFICLFCAMFAELVAPHAPFDLTSLILDHARLAPSLQDHVVRADMGGGARKYLLGTDDQGRDILSTLMYGARISLAVGFASVLISVVIGVGFGLMAG
jgi:peptide/nickel transport system permease protein